MLPDVIPAQTLGHPISSKSQSDEESLPRWPSGVGARGRRQMLAVPNWLSLARTLFSFSCCGVGYLQGSLETPLPLLGPPAQAGMSTSLDVANPLSCPQPLLRSS